MTDDQIMARIPTIKWLKPLLVVTDSHTGLSCRLCMAQNGHGYIEVKNLPQSHAAFAMHMKLVHNKKAEF